MLYHLLRNNTIIGPFTKETLLQQGLLPTDMLKTADGADWKYPSEWEEFKDFVANTSKPKFKITASKEVKEINNSQEVKKPTDSPFRRMPSALPRNSAQPNKKNFAAKSSTRNANEATNIKKATYQKTAVRNEQPAPKRSSNLFTEILLPLLIIGAIGVLGWIGYTKFFITRPSSLNIPAAIPPDTVAANTPRDTPRAALPAIKPPADSAKQKAQKDSSIAKQSQNTDSFRIKKDTTKIEPIEVAAVAIKKEDKPIVKNTPPEIHKKSIDDYISLSLNKIPNKEIKDIKLNVKNIGKEPLNIAVITVSYLNDKGVFVKSETLEIENIGVGKTVSKNIPDSKNATKIVYKTSLISGDNIYLMRK